MKIKKSILFILFALLTFFSVNAQNFITKWTFPATATSITFNAQTAGGAVNYTWSASPSGNSGSGSFTKTAAGVVTLSGLTIAAGDMVTLSMAPTNLRRFYINSGIDKDLLTEVTQWGAVPWTNMDGAFFGCTNMDVKATDIPNFADVTSMIRMFANCPNLLGNSTFNSWNTSSVTNMQRMFFTATSFNQYIGGWDVSKVTNMSETFRRASNFNQDISGWNTVAVNTLYFTFGQATAFNQPIGNWNTSAVTTLQGTFSGASAFNQPLQNWNVSAVTNMNVTFNLASSFNQQINNWNTAAVTDMSAMFYGATSFNEPIGNWDVSNVTSMWNMFLGATVFNQPIGNWNTSHVTNMSAMFQNASSFNQPLNNWNTAAVTNISSMFNNAVAFNQPIGNWTLNPTVNMMGMLDNSGLEYCNYSATLKGWAINNPTVTNRDLGATGRYYTSAVGNAERNTLITIRDWSIIDAGEVSFTAYLTPYGSTITGIASCDAGVYLDAPSGSDKKILGINANGNSSFNFSTATVTVTNETHNSTLITSPGTTIYSSPSAGYYQNTDGVNTMRILRRMHTVQQTGTYNINGGVVVRVYYDPSEINSMVTNAVPVGSNPITTSGWFKSSKHSALDVVNDLTATTLNNAYNINPSATGTENGINYTEFVLSSFSTIGYYAYTQPMLLPVTLTGFDATSNDCVVKLNWKTSTETNFSHFEIERSNDGINYTTIGTVAANGSNSNYNYTDNNAKEGKNIYRLKMIDADYKYKYSPLKLVMFSCNGNKSVVIYPNPANENINISLSGYSGKVQGSLFNNIGQLMKTTVLVNGNNSIAGTGFAKGVYNLVITEESGSKSFYKIIVIH